MTLFANLRASAWGAVGDARILRGDPFASNPPMMQAVDWAGLDLIFAGRDVALITHGFNVGYVSGMRSLARLEQTLGLAPQSLFVGVLWPGDWVVPAINYPFAVDVARQSGAKLGAFCNAWLGKARSVSLVSHSLGARVILEAAQILERPPRLICLTAGAVNDDCLSTEYQAAAARAKGVQTLGSRCDKVLSLAYPAGDIIAEILHDDHTPFQRALGRAGPRAPWPVTVAPTEIPDAEDFGHGDYLPPDDLQLPAVPNPHWMIAAGFMRRALQGAAPVWP